MKLYFVNDSRQKRLLIETNYVEDIYDEIEAFFDSHHFIPHFVKSSFEGQWTVEFGSYSERFVVEDYTADDIKEAKNFLKERMSSIFSLPLNR